MSSELKVAYICSSELARVSSLLPSNRNRSALVHTLVNAYGLLKRPNCTLVKPTKASRRDLERYHEAGYLDYVLQPHQDEETGKDDITEFGLEDLKRLDSSQKGRPKVAYLDLDLHHGDGVAEAFTSRSLDEVEAQESTVEGK
ncbi:unnamed protein product [Rhizoctonia solani]|uniref:Histone deacetylase domain-containing protein n=1 Tax=Rhizoctonia solani TaxID=456999 RepID=A0A8H3HY00_9AGAM|nr:unnamed protein product [Rhizoctonia solani]